MLELPAPATPRSTFQRQKSDQLGPITSTPSPNKPSPAQSSESAQSHRSQQDAVKITSTGDASIGRKTPSFGREEDFNDKGKNKDLQTRSSLTTVFKKGMTSHFTMGPPGRTRSPRPKQLDGACSNDDKDYFSFRASGSRSRAASIGPKSSVTAVQSHRRCISSQETQKPLWSPPLWRPAGMSRTRGSVLIHQRRNAICISSGIASLSVSRLFSPETGYCRPEDIAMAKDTDKELDPSRPVPEVAEMGASEGSNPKTRLGKLVGKVKSREFKIAFRNPFERTNNDSEGRETRTASDEVEKLSPHMTE
ncbi:hypothetical protein P154DRAFT_249175 [Amniculicola lignicola CBS 123094]|uniref:Uncharacterized protein n=1 Tax=Amniculicola lignicola CBS 123094 TaxID=1392246 RepID=A0A6A5W9E4_9PLEO|nr:hypothetical protein P154DRAFT_249175 [Amniculicola lignicola CBS 123094]